MLPLSGDAATADAASQVGGGAFDQVPADAAGCPEAVSCGRPAQVGFDGEELVATADHLVVGDSFTAHGQISLGQVSTGAIDRAEGA